MLGDSLEGLIFSWAGGDSIILAEGNRGLIRFVRLLIRSFEAGFFSYEEYS